MTFCSDLFLPSLPFPMPSSIPSRATCNLQSAGLQQGCGQAESKLGTESKLGLQSDRRGNVSQGPAAWSHLGMTKLVL